jgi:acetoin utilization deacetylase AcuC-like enzyme
VIKLQTSLNLERSDRSFSLDLLFRRILDDLLLRSFIMSNNTTTGFIWNEHYAWHDSGLESFAKHVQPHASNESSESKRRFANLVAITPLDRSLVKIQPRQATDEEILRIHTQRWLQKVKDVSSTLSGGMVGHEMHIGPRGFEIAALAAGGVLAAVEAILSSDDNNNVGGAASSSSNDLGVKRAYVLARPPGHHAERDKGHGFCCFNNIAIAAEHAIKVFGVKRIAIVDYDVHHGNGTEEQFYDRDDVLFISLHQDFLYPLTTGAVEDVGEGKGKGYNLNIPLPPGSGIGAYDYAFEKVVLPALNAFQPDLILVSSGFDPSFLDTLGRMLLRAEDFGRMASLLCKAADELCKGRIVFTHEGGYSEVYVPFCGVSVLENMSGVDSGVFDPFREDVGGKKQLLLQSHQKEYIDRAASNLEIALIK